MRFKANDSISSRMSKKSEWDTKLSEEIKKEKVVLHTPSIHLSEKDNEVLIAFNKKNAFIQQINDLILFVDDPYPGFDADFKVLNELKKISSQLKGFIQDKQKD